MRFIVNDVELTRLQAIELLKYIGDYELVTKIKEWDPPKLPVNGLDLKEAGVPAGKHMKVLLIHMYNLWKEVSF